MTPLDTTRHDARVRELAAVAYCVMLAVTVLVVVERDQVLRLDNLVHNLPLTHEAFRQWMEGRLPLWNPYLWSGSPLLADPQAQATYPLSWLGFALAGADPPAAMRLLFALHVAIAATGACVLGRALGFTDLGTLLAATVYALNPYLAYLATGFANEQATLAWLPWMAFTAIRSATSIRPWRWIALSGVAAALAWAAGYPQQWMYSAAVAVVLGWCVGRWRLRALLRSVAGPVVGLGLSLYQVLPFVSLWISSQRADVRSLDEFLAQSISIPSWPAILLPGLGGSANHDLWFVGMNISHLGLTAATLALLALWRPDPVRICLFVVAGLGLWLASGASGGLVPLLHDVPFMGFLRGPHKFFAWTVFAVALLAGAGASDLQRARRRWRAVALLVAATIAVYPFLAHRANPLPGFAAPLGYLPLTTFLVGVGGASAVAVAILLARRNETAPALALVATLASLLLELQIYGAPRPTVRAALAENPLLSAIAKWDSGWRNHYGVNLLAPFSSPDLRRALGAYRRLEMTTGYSAFLDPFYARAIGIQADVVPIMSEGTPGILDPRNRVLDVLSGRAVFVAASPKARRSDSGTLTIGELSLLVRPTALPRVREVLRVEPVADRATAIAALQTGATEPSEVALVEDGVEAVPPAREWRCALGPERRAAGYLAVAVECQRPAFLVFAERAAPGWRAWIDGGEVAVHRVYGLVLGVRVGSGKHVITLRYLPDEVVAGALASAVVAVLLALAVAWEVRRGRRGRVVLAP